MNCLLEWNGPFGQGHKKIPCRQQLDDSQKLLVTPDLEESIDKTIKKIVDRARKGPIGDIAAYRRASRSHTTTTSSVFLQYLLI